MSEATCKSCGAKILWVKTLAGKSMPLDAEPVPDGNVVLMPAGAMVLTAEMVAKHQGIGKRYVSHFSTCPNARDHRRARS